MSSLSMFEEWAVLLDQMARVAAKINDDANSLQSKIEEFSEFIRETELILDSDEIDFKEFYEKITEF